MNDFFLFEQLCALESITNNYQSGKDTGDSIRALEDYMKNRRYKVAFVGEFKRGKSSLINALIGARVLPTDILPMTAAITHIRYNDIKQIIIHYKDGKTEEKSIEELIDFATKFDEQKAKVSAQIKEVVVDYPSILCKNNIEIFDTPGMNDDEHMSDITLGILGDIDAAIMVISANAPLSITEQELILHMIEHKGIRHIVFVVTHIDAVADEIEEQDKIIAFIKNRIATKILKEAEEKFGNDEATLRKAQRILSKAHTYGVSSVLAMEGFTEDNRKKIKRSRIPVFKQELLDYLIAAQGIDAKEIFIETLSEVENNLAQWYEQEQKQLLVQKQQLVKLKAEYQRYFATGTARLLQLSAQTDTKLTAIGLLEQYPAYSAGLYKNMRRFFIRRLFRVRESEYTQEAFLQTLSEILDDAEQTLNGFNELVSETVSQAQKELFEEYSRLRPQYPGNAEEEALLNNCRQAYEKQMQQVPCPAICLQPALPKELIGINVIEVLQTALLKALQQFGTDFERFMKNWKAFVQNQHDILQSKTDVIAVIDTLVVENNAKRNVIGYHYPQDRERLKEIKKLVEAVE